MSADTDAGPFLIQKDRYSCITLNTREVSFTSPIQFGEKLLKSLSVWKTSGIRGVWVSVAIEHAAVIERVTQAGFEFHHAKPDYVMLKKWLSTGEIDNLPGYATQYLGCAGFVVNDKNQVLVIQERFHQQKTWKLPGGLADPGEEVWQAAAREVYEETGIRAEFQYLLCFRHQHNYRFGNSDFYFICVMKPLTHEIKKCEQEIAEAKWMDVEEYANHPLLNDGNRYIAQCYLKSRNQPISMQAVPVLSYNRKFMTHIYSVQPQQNSHASSSSSAANGTESDTVTLPQAKH